jgi:glycosyltransferase involved in cell wall biosynthesis
MAARTLAIDWRTNRPDLVVTYFLDSTYFAVPVARWAGVRQVVRVINNLGYWDSPKHRLLGRLVRPGIDWLLTNSVEGRTALARRTGFPESRIQVIENGVDLDRFPKTRFPKGRPIHIGCVANLRPVKNIDGLMRVAARLIADHPGIVFSVAGDGPERLALEQLQSALNLEQRFILRGSTSDIPEYLSMLDLFVLPSHSEGMSNALLEAMAAGLPIVATEVGANRRVLGEGGFLVPPGSDDALVNAIRRLIADPERGHLLGRAARSRVESEFSRTAMLARFAAFFEQIVGESPVRNAA